MIQFMVMLLGLVFGNMSSGSNNNSVQPTTQLTNPGGGTDPGDGTGGPGSGGGTTGDTGQTPPPFTNP